MPAGIAPACDELSRAEGRQIAPALANKLQSEALSIRTISLAGGISARAVPL